MTAGSPHQALYRRWRAQTFTEIVGQEAVVATLRNAVRTGQVSHAILFTGPRGTGKTSLARIVAKALNCTDLAPTGDPCDACPSCVAIREGTTLDVIEIDAASNRGINEVRELRERLAYAPAQLRRKVYILDEAHQITRDAWNALLKSLEEPPEFVSFMFASTHPQDFPPAILSRLQRFDVRRLTVDEIAGKLERILAADGREADPDAVRLVARLAAGGMRDAESILDQLLSSTGDRIAADAVRELLGLADAELVAEFVAALVSGDAIAGITGLDRLEERGRDLRVFLDQVVDELRDRILAGLDGGRAVDPALARAARRLSTIDPTRLGPGGLRLQLELALLEALPGASVAPASGVPGQVRVDRPVDRPVGAAPASAPPAQAAPEQAPPSATTVLPAPASVARPSRTGRPRPASSEPRDSADVQVTPRDGADAPATPRGAEHAPVPAIPAATADAGSEPATGPLPSAARAPDPGPTPDASPGGGAAAGEPPAAGGDLDRLRTGWTQVVGVITGRNPAAKPLISACRPIGVEGNIVTLGFPEEQGFLKDVAERRRPLLEDCIGGYLGHPVGVRCVATNLDLLPPLPADEDAARILEEAQRIFAEDLADVPEVT